MDLLLVSFMNDDGKLFLLNAPKLGVCGYLFDDIEDTFEFSLKSPSTWMWVSGAAVDISPKFPLTSGKRLQILLWCKYWQVTSRRDKNKVFHVPIAATYTAKIDYLRNFSRTSKLLNQYLSKHKKIEVTLNILLFY